mmetsp:Transcript_26221/g.40644  ORF Transcript_26221/g.40644 Transcript_26221/m.40644 type:complete len:263 (-) Transcript_26221:52-840(-)
MNPTTILATTRAGSRNLYRLGVTVNVSAQRSASVLVSSSSTAAPGQHFMVKNGSLPAGLVEQKARFFSDEKGAKPPIDDSNEDEKVDGETATAEESSEEATTDAKVAELEKQVSNLKEQVLRALAEQENTRRIAKKDVDSARQFAVTSFAKSLLDVSDNLARAMNAVPEELRNDTENNPVLATLFEGIEMTDNGLTKAFEKNGLVKFGELGDKFDPNYHNAMFEYPDPEKEAGSIGQVMKVGFMLHGRTIRPAEVGVIKKTD